MKILLIYGNSIWDSVVSSTYEEINLRNSNESLAFRLPRPWEIYRDWQKVTSWILQMKSQMQQQSQIIYFNLIKYPAIHVSR